MLGWGTYRAIDNIPATYLAVRTAGISIIDTAPNYGGGCTQRQLASVADGTAVLISKIGYTSGDPQSSNRPHHNLRPSYVRWRVNQTRKCFDGYPAQISSFLIHNPEHVLDLDPQAEVEDFFRETFSELEQLRQSGAVQSYGVAAWRWPDSRFYPDTLLQIAKEVAGGDHGFRYYMFPMNIVRRELTEFILRRPESMKILKSENVQILISAPFAGGLVRDLLGAPFEPWFDDSDPFRQSLSYLFGVESSVVPIIGIRSVFQARSVSEWMTVKPMGQDRLQDLLYTIGELEL